MHRTLLTILVCLIPVLIFGDDLKKKKPKIVGQNSISTAEEVSRTIMITDLLIEFEESDDDEEEDDEGDSDGIEDLVLEVEDGENYSVSGTTVTPDDNFNGTLSVPVSVNNGEDKSNKYSLSVEVTEENDPPTITGQVSLQTPESQAITITLNDLTVTDPDNTYPDGFSLTLYSGTNYTLDGSNVLPDEGFVGTLSVPVTVSDGTDNSNTFDLQIEVTNVNDAPVITGQEALQVNEDNSLQIALTNLTVTDADDSYPADFTLSVLSGSDYAVSGTTITPSENFTGTLTVPVTVNDGEATSNQFDLSVTVNAVNDQPVITGQSSLAISENESLIIELSHLTVTDPDSSYPGDFTLAVSNGSNYTVSENTITPSAGFNGTLSIPVTVSDGTTASDAFNLQVTVNAVNDAPQITGQSSLQVSENSSLTLSLDHLTVTDPDNNYPADFTLSVQAGSNYTVSENTITPSDGFNGTLSVPVTVSDGALSSNVFNVQVSVTAVNNPPVISGQNSLQTNEDQSITLKLADLIVSDPDNTYPTDFTMAVSSGSNYTVSGTTVTPAKDFSGTLSVPVTVNDGSLSSEPFNVQIQVNSQNDAPVITGQKTLTTAEDQPLTISLADLTVSDLDNDFPTGFTLNVGAGENYTVSGTTITPAANFFGTLSVPVTVSDGLLTSVSFSLNIAVTPVNDIPVITGQQPLSVNEETSLSIELSYVIVTDPDNTYPEGFSLNVLAGTNYTNEANVITPAGNFAGALSVPVTVSDGTSTSQPFNLQITVQGINDPPIITGQKQLTVQEDNTLTIAFSDLSVNDSDNTYPTNFSMSVSPGENYTVSDKTITPAANFSGNLIVAVTVNDGNSTSEAFNLSVTVVPVNDAPVITGQTSATIYKNKTFSIDPSHLTVDDPDDRYPEDFTIKVGKGENYTVFENVITPRADFVGTLNIPITVNDGDVESAPFTFQLPVVTPPNVKPVIVSQVTLTTYEDEPIDLLLSHLVVSDPDDKFPDDFTMQISEGDNYTLSGKTITPTDGFSGQLNVSVTVNDGEISSDPFIVIIQVAPVSDIPLIASQSFVRINEDDSVTLDFSKLVVIDPDNTYPNGFTLSALPGENYTLRNLLVKPAKNFNGYLSVPVTVNDGTNSSAQYNFLILVDAVNDAPTVTDAEPGMLLYLHGKGSLNVFENVIIEDVDDDSLSFAEIIFNPTYYEQGRDTISYISSTAIRTIYDPSTGLLVLFGKAAVNEYQKLINSIQYNYSGDIRPTVDQKTLSIKLSDGKVESDLFEKVISFEADEFLLDIPTGFTPNGDGANDTWNIKSLEGNDSFSNAVIRVYNNRGALVFEGIGLNTEWDGRMNGNLLPADTYFYTIDLQGSHVKNRYQGIVTILR